MFKNRRKQKQSNSGKLFGALFGLAMFAGSFFLLWTNEGRINYGDIAKESITISAKQQDLTNQSELIALEGDLFTKEKITDPDFFEATKYIQLNRIAEMYAWVEKEVTEDDETFYEYSTEWTETPENSNTFNDPEFVNPSMIYQSIRFTVSTAFIDVYQIDSTSIRFPEPLPVDLIRENIKEEILHNSIVNVSNEFLYFGYYSVDNPEIGDLRISYTAISPKENVTAFGSINDTHLIPYTFEEDGNLYRLFFVDRENAILQMDEEFTAALWGSRFAGFALMWCGLFLILNPITIIISFLPILEKAGFWLLIAITFPVAAIISFLLVLFSFIAHNPFVLFGLIFLTILTIGIIAYSLYTADKRKKEEVTS